MVSANQTFRHFSRIIALPVTLLFCIVFLASNAAIAQAASLPQLPSDSTPKNGAIPVAIHTRLDQPSARDTALALIREYRAEAYDEGIISLPNGMTRDTYLSNFGWDSSLERIAIQRGAEACLVLDHTRPDGTSCFTACTESGSSYGEILAWPGANIATGFAIWKTEKDDYIKKINGEFGYGETGHYEALISPYNTAYGFAAVGVSNASYGSCACGETGTWSADGKSTGYSGSYDAVINVVDSAELSCSLGIRASKTTIAPGRTSQLSIPVTLSPYADVEAWVDASRVTFTSTKPDIATVDATGLVTGVSEGTTAAVAAVGDKAISVDIAVAYSVDMQRLYNPNSGEHLYTADWSECTYLASIGWKYEGVGWKAPTDSDSPVYRLYNPNAGEHHYTTDASEKDALVSVGWNYEDVGWYSAASTATPLYRQYNPNQFACNHNYTTDIEENDYLVSIGWRPEGVGWYGL